jgi:hypothetical protein
MTNPWDRPPLPTYGDLEPEELYRAVGAMASAWETIEFDLCLIFSVFAEDPKGEAMRLYGENRTFPGRLDTFSRKAESYFIKGPNQNREIELHQFLKEVIGFCERRNEIIHGIVLRINNLNHYLQHLADKSPKPFQFAVIPPYHMVRSHGDDGFPLYAYNAAMITHLLELMWNLHERLGAFRKSLSA